jgi:hypothetical protein
MWPAEALGQVERPFHADIVAVERLAAALLAVPHLQAGLDGLLEDVEALPQRWERESQSCRLLGVVARADAEHRPAAGEDVEGGDHLGEEPGRPVGSGGRESHEPHPLCLCGDEAERRICLDVVFLRSAHDRMQPHMVSSVDHVEAHGLGGLDDFC